MSGWKQDQERRWKREDRIWNLIVIVPTVRLLLWESFFVLGKA